MWMLISCVYETCNDNFIIDVDFIHLLTSLISSLCYSLCNASIISQIPQST